MREIKFRAWDTRMAAMVHSASFGNFVHPRREDQHGVISLGHIPEIIVMQFTGLKDKNKKEIYEGDICEQITPNGRKIRMVCRWGVFQRTMDTGWTVDISGFCFERSDGLMALPIVKNWMGKHDLETLEVIGNIYQHPELLK